MAIKVRDDAILGLDRALGAWTDVSQGLWQQATARLQATIAEGEALRRRRAARVAALERTYPPESDPRRGDAKRLLTIARQQLEDADQALIRLSAAAEGLRAAQSRSVRSLVPLVDAARADLQRRLRVLDAYSGSAQGRGPSGTQSSVSSPANLSSSALAARGLENVDLATVDFSDNPIIGAFGRGDAGLADYRWSVETWESVVRPGLNRGLDRSAFEQRDQARRASPLRRTADVFDLFLGDSDQIVLSRRADGRYDVVNGRHRIQVARELGISVLPARVIR